MISDTKISFSYDPDLHKTICKRNVHNKVYTGEAQCHPCDYDFENKLTGQHYAYIRSVLQEMCALRDEYKIQLKALKHLYSIYELNCGDCSSNECYYLRRQIQIVKRDIEDMKILIRSTRDDLRTTIAEKDRLYSKLRDARSNSNK